MPLTGSKEFGCSDFLLCPKHRQAKKNNHLNGLNISSSSAFFFFFFKFYSKTKLMLL